MKSTSARKRLSLFTSLLRASEAKSPFFESMNEQIVILDFGSQYTQVIARRIRHVRSASCTVLALLATSCAPSLMKLPAGAGTPAADAADALIVATARCSAVSSLSAEIVVSGSVAGQPFPTSAFPGTRMRIASDGRILTGGEFSTSTGGGSGLGFPGSYQVTATPPTALGLNTITDSINDGILSATNPVIVSTNSGPV